MPQTYASLVEEWKEAAGATRAAQQELKELFDAHLAGGAAPSTRIVQRLNELRRIEAEKLQATIEFLEFGARGRRSTSS